MRDFDKNPYSPDERRVANWFSERDIGGGDDPIGSLVALYEFVLQQRNELRDAAKPFVDAAKWFDRSQNYLDTDAVAHKEKFGAGEMRIAVGDLRKMKHAYDFVTGAI